MSCKYQASFEAAQPEKKKELLLEKCSVLESCADNFKKSSEAFTKVKGQLSQYDAYLQTLVDTRPPPESVKPPKSISFLNATSFDSLNGIYRATDYYYKGGDGLLNPSRTGTPDDEDIKEDIKNNPHIIKSTNEDSKESLSWYIDTINQAVSDPETYFGVEASELTEQFAKLAELKKVLQEMAKILINVSTQNCAEKVFIIEQQQKAISASETGVASTGRGGYGDLPLDERVAAAEALAADVGAGTGAGILLNIPKDFSEQCIFLSQIFQFAEYHRDFQGGASGTGTVDSVDVRTRMTLNAIQGGGTGKGDEIVLKKLPYYGGNSFNSSLVVEGQPFGFINRLTQYQQMSQFFEATNAQLANLQPMIRLFKVIPEGKSEIQVPFKFDTFANASDVEELLTRKDKRGFGVGISNFNYVLDGNNPFAVKKSIQANLTIKAANMSELLKNREIKGQTFRYVDLALKTGKSIKEKTGNKELDFRIKAVIGIERPNGEHKAGNFYEIEEAIKNNFVTLNLTPVTHTFDFDETGAVTFKIEYRAYIEEYFDKARMNIFADPIISTSVIERRLALKTQRKNCTDEDQVKKLNEFIEQDADSVKQEKIDSLKFLTSELNKKKYIYFLSLSQEQFNDFITKGPFADVSDIRDSISLDGTNVETLNTELEENFQKAYEAAKDNKNLENSFKLSGIAGRQFAFFYLGDLVDLIMEKIDNNLQVAATNLTNNYKGLEIDEDVLTKEREVLNNSIGQFKKMRVVLGPVEIVDHRNQTSSRNVSFSDIPISLNYFNEWLTTKLLAKDSANYPLTQFLNDLMNDLVRNYLNDDSCYSFNIKQKVRVFQSTLTSYKQKGQEEDDISKIAKNNPRRRLDLDSKDLQLPVLNIGGHKNFKIGNMNPNLENHYFVYYAGRVQPKEFMTGNRELDQSRGIFHYILGRDRGIVKNIKLNKTDSPGLKEVRFEQEGYDGLYQLREIYDVNIDTFANIHAFPGTYIYVEPRGFSPSLGAIDLKKFDLTDLGIGGYYMIINSEHNFEAGVMATSLTAKWVQSLDADNKESESDSSSGSGDKTVKKCTVAAAGSS